MIFETLETGPLAVNCYILGTMEGGEAVVIDPGGHVPRILQILAKHRLQNRIIINTHGHFDHMGGNKGLKDATGASLMIHRADAPVLATSHAISSFFGAQVEASPKPDRLLEDREVIQLGEMKLEVIHTPGHSPGGICLWWEAEAMVFVGDTLFAGSVGRTDLPGGSARTLVQGIRDRLLPLGDHVRVYPGHGPATTIGEERKTNPFIAEKGGSWLP